VFNLPPIRIVNIGPDSVFHRVPPIDRCC
jgi:hypothetical protein